MTRTALPEPGADGGGRPRGEGVVGGRGVVSGGENYEPRRSIVDGPRNTFRTLVLVGRNVSIVRLWLLVASATGSRFDTSAGGAEGG